ncbi:hypothetical protein [Gluconobacter cerinus]|uniref:Uncharacterized protein n=1 Tax=Gluconobacter cerinus TaxID=38307 RepID=A0A1B6VPB3_9PROT|nr:hypothetical protein [Gluconobacter cerinus]OAJ69049.1 hypothetical protein A0123_00619 [Gluconobacter cerinus]
MGRKNKVARPSQNPFKGGGVAREAFKAPGRASSPINSKQPSIGGVLEHVAAQQFRWSFDQVDWGGPYCWAAVPAEKILREVIPRLQEFEKKKWGEIQATGSHDIEVENIIKAAQVRLQMIYKDQYDSVYSLRVQGEERIFGVKDKAIFRVLWWDPKHSICPSKLKHT